MGCLIYWSDLFRDQNLARPHRSVFRKWLRSCLQPDKPLTAGASIIRSDRRESLSRFHTILSIPENGCVFGLVDLRCLDEATYLTLFIMPNRHVRVDLHDVLLRRVSAYMTYMYTGHASCMKVFTFANQCGLVLSSSFK